MYRLWVRDTLNAREYIATKKYKKETFETQITIKKYKKVLLDYIKASCELSTGQVQRLVGQHFMIKEVTTEFIDSGE